MLATLAVGGYIVFVAQGVAEPVIAMPVLIGLFSDVRWSSAF